MTQSDCNSVLESEVNRSLERENESAALQYLTTVSYSLSASSFCQHSAIICSFNLPLRMATVNNLPSEAQREEVTLSHQMI